MLVMMLKNPTEAKNRPAIENTQKEKDVAVLTEILKKLSHSSVVSLK